MAAVEINYRELASVLAGLRALQHGQVIEGRWLEVVRTDGGQFEALTAAEIDELCERLNPIDENQRWTIAE
jgi:hypothetical protein